MAQAKAKFKVNKYTDKKYFLVRSGGILCFLGYLEWCVSTVLFIYVCLVMARHHSLTLLGSWCIFELGEASH